MQKISRNTLLPLLAALLLVCGVPATAYAGFGTGIGVSFPLPSSGGSDARPESYASFCYGGIIQELTVTERSGRLLLELKVTNDTDAPYTIEHRNGQLYDFAILDKNGAPLYRWSEDENEGVAFSQALTTASYPAHETAIYKAELTRKAYKQIKEDAVLVTAYLTDTPYRLMARIPAAEKSSTPLTLHGAIVVGNGRWYDD